MRWGGKMKKLSTLVIHNLKKDKGSYISFGVIILFTAFMLNLAMVLAFQVDKSYDKKFEQLNTANINVCISQAANHESLEDKIANIDGVETLESRDAILTTAVVKNFRGTDFSMNTIFYRRNEPRQLNLLEGKATEKEESEDSIYVPLYVGSFGEFSVGEDIIYEVNGTEMEFHISGIVEEMQYGNYGMGWMGAYLSDEVYERFSQGKEENRVVEYSVKAEKTADIEEVTKEISDLLEQENISVLSNIRSDAAKQTRTMVCNLLILILLAFAFVILLVSVFLCKFRIQNSIEEEMINLGVLKAVGYTGNMMIGTMVIPYLLVGMVGVMLGVGLSYSILPMLSEVLALQSGFSFALHFDGKALVVVSILLLGIIVLFTYRAARRIRKIQPIHAIRGTGEIGKGSSAARQKILLFLVSFVLMILVAFASTLFYNVIIVPDHFMKTLSEEMTQIIFTPEADQEKQLDAQLKKDRDVSHVLQYMTATVEFEDLGITTFVCEDYDEVSNDLCYIGRNPKSEEEIALGSAFAQEYDIGNYVEIQMGENTKCYEVVGFVQSVNYQGEICELTLEGYEALVGQEVVSSRYVYLKEDVEAEAFLEKFEEKHSDQIQNSINYDKMTKTSQEMFTGLAAVMITAIFVLTVLIVIFIFYVVIKSMLTQRKQEFGIYKAIGYTNRQLILKLIGSFLPVSAVGVLMSAVLALVYMPYINQWIFQSVGAMKNSLEVSFVFLLLFALAQLGIDFIISICLAMPMKKISVYALIKE